MINKKMYEYGTVRSCIRDLFEFGMMRAAIVGKENVSDFSIGNPSVPAPAAVNEAIKAVLDDTPSIVTHGYTSAVGLPAAREAIAKVMNERYNAGITKDNLYLTCGAAASLTSVLKALNVSDDTEVLAIAPFFPEYTCFVESAGSKLVLVPADEVNFQINFDELEKSINKNTQAVIINSPNNPSGVIYSKETLEKLATILVERSKEYGHVIYIIADEPYRELVYDGAEVPYIPAIYPNTVVCYSYSKSLSLPGERIGYIMVPPCVEEWEAVYAAAAGAARAMGYVCAPSLMQAVIARVAEYLPDLDAYARNRELLYKGLIAQGYECANPAGAFYLFVKAPDGDSEAFSEAAKKYDLLVVPGTGFGCKGYFRLCYAVSEDTIKRALPKFEALMAEYK